MSFFTSTSLQMASPERLVPQCGVCKLYTKCKSPKMPVTGKGRKGMLIVGEAPGKTEDLRNEQFVGDAGQKLRTVLRKYGIDLDQDCWKTNAVICHPKDASGNNRTPTDKEIEWCRPSLTKTISELNPVNIITLGGSALRSLMPPIWKDDQGYAVERWNGWNIPCQKLNMWICPTYHPSWVIREENARFGKPRPEGGLANLIFERQIAAAVKLTERPWQEVPDYRKRVDVIWDGKQAAERIMLMTEMAIRNDTSISFDFETNMLKPDSRLAQIICCAMSDGRRSIAFNWEGRAEKAAVTFIKSEAKKSAQNLKMENRWFIAKYGEPVSNIVWDSMIASHVLDCRGGITGLKFQAFVNFGQAAYNEDVKEFMDSPSNMPNRLKEADRQKVLVYCALDALFEAMLARKQMKIFEECGNG